MLDANLKTQLKSYLERITQPVELIASLDDRPVIAPIIDLRDSPTSTGASDASDGSARASARLSSKRLPKPNPGSMTIRSRRIPAATQAWNP